jgi:hypothetical protein
MENKWLSTTAGILDIIAGVWALCVVIALFIAGGITSIIPDIPAWISTVLFSISIPIIILAVLAIAGGIANIVKRSWGFALTGSIAAFFCSFSFFFWGFVLGVLAIVLTTVGRSEFK